MYLEAPRHSPVRLPRTRLTGSSAPTLTNIFVHSGSMASRNLHLAECLPAMVGDLHVLLHLGVRQGRLAFLASLCLEPLLQGLPQPVLHENRGPVRRRGNVGRGVVLEGVRDVEVVLPACDLLLDEGLLLALVDLATLDLGQHELVQANVPAAFAEELLIQVRTLAGGRLQDQLGEARPWFRLKSVCPPACEFTTKTTRALPSRTWLLVTGLLRESASGASASGARHSMDSCSSSPEPRPKALLLRLGGHRVELRASQNCTVKRL